MILKIKGLFNKYDHTINLSNRLNILIGENGVGKTTILNIISCLYNFDFIKLSKYNFKTIELIDDKDHFKINIDDFFPEANELIKLIKEDMKNDEFMQFYGEYAIADIEYMFNNGNYAKFIKEIIFDQNDLNKHNVSSYGIKDHEYQVISIIESHLNKLKIYYIDAFSISKKNRINSNHYKLSKLSFILGQIESFISKNLNLDYGYFFLSLVNDINLSKNYCFGSSIYSEKLEWLIQGEKIGNIDRKLTKDEYYSHMDHNKVKRKLKGKVIPIGYNINNYFSEETVKLLLNELFNNIDFNIGIFEQYENSGKKAQVNVFDYIEYKLQKEHIFDINKLINLNYFSDEFLIEFNKKAIQYYIKDIYNFLDYRNLERESFKDFDLLNRIQYFCLPAILRNSPFDIDISELSDNYDKLIFRKFIDFAKNNIQMLLLSENDTIANFQILIDKYIKNKKITITPAGLLISLDDDIYIHDLALNQLSSGEKKLLIIFAVCLLMENKTLIIDEPELSLSLIWQEQILPDLMKYTKISKIIVATHSPAIISDETLIDKVLFLPNGVDNNE